MSDLVILHCTVFQFKAAVENTAGNQAKVGNTDFWANAKKDISTLLTNHGTQRATEMAQMAVDLSKE